MNAPFLAKGSDQKLCLFILDGKTQGLNPFDITAKLLRFLEDGSFTRVGGTQELRVNVRFIAATNREIVQAIDAGHFREDLFHRLNVVQFQLPPLRERGEDILLLAGHFLKLFRATMNKNVNGLAPATRQKLLAHRWPGNWQTGFRRRY